MDFNELILEKLHPLFIKHGFEVEHTESIFNYQSKGLVISLSHNSRENSNILWIGKKRLSNSVEIDDYIMQNFFHSELKINNLPQNIFVNNVFLFFINTGKDILRGDKQVIIDLEKFDNNRNTKYTLQLIDNQYIKLTNKAWNEGNYKDVIKYLKEVNNDSLTESFKKRYKIAQQRLSN